MIDRFARYIAGTLGKSTSGFCHMGADEWNRTTDLRFTKALQRSFEMARCSASFPRFYSSIWLYSLAPPIWDFVEHNRFDGKRGVLFNTFNSQFKSEYIETFKAKVMERGARSFEHRFVRRGRMTQQISPSEMVSAIESQWFIEDVEPRLDTSPIPSQ